MHSVSVRDVSLNFGSVKVLEKLNLDITEGEFLVLLGPSGCGKSTLLNCIAGLLDVSDGQIFINGKNVTWEQPKDRGIGMVFQSYALYPQMTVEGNLSFGLKNQGVPRAEIRERVDRAAKMLQIEPYLQRKPAHLSGGQRQRVAIGRALVREAGVFLFDEPLSNLDAKLRLEMRAEIRGRDLLTGLPRTLEINTREIREAIEDRVADIVDAIKVTLDRTPPELAADIMERGITLTGGGSLLNGLSQRIRAETGMPVWMAPDPRLSVVLGAGRALEEFGTFGEVIFDDTPE